MEVGGWGGVSHVGRGAQVRNKKKLHLPGEKGKKTKATYVGGFSDEQTTNNVSGLRRGEQKHTDGRGADCAESAPAAATNRGDPKSCA